MNNSYPTKLVCFGLLFFLLIDLDVNAQVGINTNSPDPSSILDITSADKGLLIPRVSIADLSTIAPVTGGSTESLLVYNTNVATTKGFYYWDGSNWVGLAGSGGGSNDDWNLIGNSSTNPATNYLGTSDNQPLAFRTNGTEYMRLLTDGSLGLGTTTTGGGSLMDVDSSTKGILIPRLNIEDLATIDPVTGGSTESLLAYNTNISTGKGIHYWDGSKWVKLAQTTSDDWTTTGNAGTTPAGNFIGTTDAIDTSPASTGGFAFRTNNVERMRLTEHQYYDTNGISWAYLGIGTTTPGEIMDCLGDMDVGGDGTNWDGLSETIKIRAQSNSFYIGVKNDASDAESDYFIGLSDDPDEADFRLEPSGDVSIGKDDDDPQDLLHITKDQEETTTLRIDNDRSNGGGDMGTSLELWMGTTEVAYFKHQNKTDVLEIGNTNGSGEVDFYLGSGVVMNFASGNVNVINDLSVTGALSKGSGTFKIDHPLDPENKYLYHSFVESPDMLNIYNGNITTDDKGLATIELPEYFSALNKDFKYQLSAVNSFSEVMVLEEVKDNNFIIQSELPNVKISWQVTGVRQDPYANMNRVIPEVEKESYAKGKYLYPEVYGLDKEQGINNNNNVKN